MSSTLSPKTFALQTLLKALHARSSKPLCTETLSLALEELLLDPPHEAPQELVGAVLASLTIDRLTPEIIATAATVLRKHSIQVPIQPSPSLIDIVGTGGDGLNCFNASTAASFVVAAAGGCVAKHGNRSSSSKSGSADLLESLGGKLDLESTSVIRVLEQTADAHSLTQSSSSSSPTSPSVDALSGGFVFLFAQKFHPALKRVATVRRSLGIKTLFNLLGPLINPITPTYQLSGVADKTIGAIYAETLVRVGVRRAAVVHSHDGQDEISTSGSSTIWLATRDETPRQDGSYGCTVQELHVTPADFGLPTHEIALVASGTSDENAALLLELFALTDLSPEGLNKLTARQRAVLDYIILNASLAIWVLGLADNFAKAAQIAKENIQSGKALAKVKSYVQYSQQEFHNQQNKKATSTTNTSSSSSPQPTATSSSTSAAPATTGSSPSILHRIAAHRVTLIDAEKALISEHQLMLNALQQSVPSLQSILPRLALCSPHVSLAAELKRASPSLGDIQLHVDVEKQVRAYAEGGAALLSVLTEPHWFKGTIADLRHVRKLVECYNPRPCILLKDFVLTTYQILQARVNGADTVLLIVALFLGDAEKEQSFLHLLSYSRSLGMEPLVEVATAAEMRYAVQVGARFIGVNNRDLHTFTMDGSKTNGLAAVLEEELTKLRAKGQEAVKPVLAALSGIKTHADVVQYQQARASMVLVGETLMKSNDVLQTIRDLLGYDPVKHIQTKEKEKEVQASSSSSSSSGGVVIPASGPLVKLCGFSSISDVSAALSFALPRTAPLPPGVSLPADHKESLHYCDFLGLIFAEKSKRRVTVETASDITQYIKRLPAFTHRSGIKHSSSAGASEKALAVIRQLIASNQGKPLVVGVFQDQPAAYINSIAQQVGLDLVQLHGSEQPHVMSQIIRPIIRSIGVTPGQSTVESVRAELQSYHSLHSDSGVSMQPLLFLLDTKSATSSGGSGQAFDWSIATVLCQEFPILLAGGLTPDTVKGAIAAVHPLGVDVASGIELEDVQGQPRKSKDKIKAFLQAVEQQS